MNHPYSHEDFESDVKDYFRLFNQKKDLQERMKSINQEMKDHNDKVLEYMKNNNIPAIEFGGNVLKFKTSKRTPGITKKMIMDCPFFQNDELRTQFFESLPRREPKEVYRLAVTKKT